MKTIRIAGVPEHFNLPWHLCIESGEFEEVGLDVQWTDVPEGTGKMCQMLRNEETDIAIILTEGIVKDIVEGNDSRIVQVYVESPLIWGIHVDNKASFSSVSDLKNAKVAVSRMGSGSHLMAVVNAERQNWDTKQLEFEIVNNVHGAIEALSSGKADYFMWEKFTTKPLVDNGTFKRIAECPTPWPCFVIAVRDKFLKENKAIIEQILDIINTTTEEFKYIPSIDRNLATRYDQKIEDIQLWLSKTQWSQKQLDEKTFNTVQNQLFKLNLIKNKLDYAKVVS
jgi:ABC-type nitrate/sulfonate/bicarbonate transport system substrate-binding protein